MENYFSSNPLYGLGLVLNAAGSGRDPTGFYNTLNLLNSMQDREEKRAKEMTQEAAAKSFLNNMNAVGSPAYRKTTFTPNPEDVAGVKFGNQIFGGEEVAPPQSITFGQDAPAKNLLSSQDMERTLATAVGPQNYLTMKLEEAQKAKAPLKLGKDEQLLDPITHKVIASNNTPDKPQVETLFDEQGREIKVVMGPDGTFKPIGGAKVDTSNQESWGNPVSEIDPATGKNIQVRYSNKGNRQVVPNAVPARQGNAFDRADYWRSQFKPSLDSAQNASAQSAKIKNALALNKGTGDIAAINALQKMIDEGGVVRSEDVNLITSAQSVYDTLKTKMGRLEKGDVLNPELRKQVQDTADALSKAIYSGVQSRIEPFVPTMKGEGIELENIVPEQLRKTYGWAQTTGGTLPVGGTATVNGVTIKRIK